MPPNPATERDNDSARCQLTLPHADSYFIAGAGAPSRWQRWTRVMTIILASFALLFALYGVSFRFPEYQQKSVNLLWPAPLPKELRSTTRSLLVTSQFGLPPEAEWGHYQRATIAALNDMHAVLVLPMWAQLAEDVGLDSLYAYEELLAATTALNTSLADGSMSSKWNMVRELRTDYLVQVHTLTRLAQRNLDISLLAAWILGRKHREQQEVCGLYAANYATLRQLRPTCVELVDQVREMRRLGARIGHITNDMLSAERYTVAFAGAERQSTAWTLGEMLVKTHPRHSLALTTRISQELQEHSRILQEHTEQLAHVTRQTMERFWRLRVMGAEEAQRWDCAVWPVIVENEGLKGGDGRREEFSEREEWETMSGVELKREEVEALLADARNVPAFLRAYAEEVLGQEPATPVT